jgi:DNA-binding XRE family transcriptional regulator
MLYSLNENIKRLRIANGMNQVEFANLIGVTKQCVSNWENDNVLPSIEMLTKIADVFKVKTDYLLGREEKKAIDVSGLTDEQIGHITLIINDLEALNSKNK